MPVHFDGGDKVVRQLRDKLTGPNALKIHDQALIAGSKEFLKELKRQFNPWQDLGWSIDDMTASDPYWKDGKRTISIHWNGPRGRYRIIHLNENGTIYNPQPKGKGSIARAMKNSEKTYLAVIKRELERGI